MSSKVPVAFILLISQILTGVQTSDLKWKWEVWEDIPSESFLSVYLFNVKNPDEFELGEKPIFNQIGPYVFSEKSRKVSITKRPENRTVEFRTLKTYEFIREKSVGSEDDLVTIVNIPLLTFGKILGEVPYVGPNFFKSIVKSGEKLTRRNERVGDVFYYGFTADPYIKVLDQLNPGEPIPEQFSGGRFGLFKGRNGTDTGEYSIQTGDADSEYGRIASWKGITELNWWTGSTCNMINGTQGTSFEPKSLSKFYIRTFDPDACRSLTYKYHGTAEFQGVRGWKYIFDQNMLADPRVSEATRCFCSKPGEDLKYEGCYKRGIIDLAPCRNGAPLALSYPHFYDADKEYMQNVTGMEPKRDSHESFILVEPKTGTVLQDVKRFQLNIQVKRTPSLSYLKNAPNRLLPVFWSEKTYSLDPVSLKAVKEELKNHVLDDDVDASDGSWNQNLKQDGTMGIDSSHGGNWPKNSAAQNFDFTSLLSFSFIYIFLTIV